MVDDEFDRVFLAVSQRLFARVAALVGSRHRADDLVHDVYVRLKSAGRRRDRFLGHANPYGYALATAVNLARGGWRSDRRLVPLERAAPATCDGDLPAVDSWDRVACLLDSLTGKEKAVVMLVDLDGHTLEEAAALLRVHKGTVQRNRERALAKLQGRLRALAAANG
ncbi:RNA polymerase sigma factor [Amycolatopsis sp. NPDC059027]|uniref:RNA polymerase sigma factor n=1 Tax=unclassified Amycolatopsis TaxID=2618356 RepID=UPI00366E1D4A